MVESNLFSRGNLVKAIIIFFGITCFLKMLPAAIEPEPVAKRLKGVIFEPEQNLTDSHFIFFRDASDQKNVADPIFLQMLPGYMRRLPIQNIKMSVRKIPDVTHPVFEQDFTADTIERLQKITIDNSGRIVATFDPIAAQQRPAAIEPASVTRRWQDVLIEPGPDYTGDIDYVIRFMDAANKLIVQPFRFVHFPLSEIVRLPIEKITIQVSSHGRQTFKGEFNAEEVVRLQKLIVDGNGIITAQSLPPFSNIPYKWIKIGGSATSRKKYPTYYIRFKGDGEIFGAITIDNNNYIKQQLANIPARELSIQVTSKAGLIFKSKKEDIVSVRKLTADEVARLTGLTIEPDGSIVPSLLQEQPAVIAPTAELTPAAPVPAPDISRYHEIIKKGDLEGLRAILPAVKQAGKIDEPDKDGIPALGYAIIMYKNSSDSYKQIALEMINELLANDASLFVKGPSGKELLDYAEDQRGNLLNSIVIPGDCAVCFETKQLMLLPCGHPICAECYNLLLQRAEIERLCPSCRKSFPH